MDRGTSDGGTWRGRPGAERPPTALQAEGLKQRALVYATWVTTGLVAREVARRLLMEDAQGLDCNCELLLANLLPLVERASAMVRTVTGARLGASRVRRDPEDPAAGGQA